MTTTSLEFTSLNLSKELDQDLIIKIKNLYTKAFPPAERMPYEWLEKASLDGNADILAILDGKNFIGLIISLIKDNTILLDYFAIDESFRNKGYGSLALNLLKKFYPKQKIILEIEITTPTKDIIQLENLSETDLITRIKRKNFYLNNGLKETGIYISLNNIIMELLNFGESLDFEEYIGTYIYSFGKKIRKHIFEVDYNF